jgi:class 3 adenylate cyclase
MHLPSGLVTFLFTDIEGSTRLAQMLGSGYRPVLNEHRQVIRRTVADAEGAELFTEGDSLFVAFPDASAALVACAEAQRRLASHDWPSSDARPRVRMGLHTGYAEPLAGEYASPEVHRAARVAAAAHGGQVLCSAATAARSGDLEDDAFLLDLGLHQLRGFDGRERLFQVVADDLERDFPRPRTVAATAHNLPVPAASFVGRVRERGELADLLSIDLGDGALATGELTVRVMLADLDHLDWLADRGFATASLPARRRRLMADFDRLHALVR